MALLLRSSRILQRVAAINPAAVNNSTHAPAPVHSPIGKREVVGFGHNGKEIYVDRFDYPMPAIRYKEPSPEIMALREKEKGDWKKLTIQEKKELYRASFCQTYAEMDAPTGEWKSIVGCTMFFVGLSLWIFMGVKAFVLPDLPESMSLERQQAQLKRIIDISVDPVEGISSKWDYEKGDWKK